MRTLSNADTHNNVKGLKRHKDREKHKVIHYFGLFSTTIYRDHGRVAELHIGEYHPQVQAWDVRHFPVKSEPVP